MTNIVFIGFGACYKSSVGKIVARKLHKDFYDTDAIIEQAEGRSARQIICDSGENYFRNAENAVLNKIATCNNAVVACGGGSVLCNDFNKLVCNATVVWLTATPSSVAQRLDGISRPLYDGANIDELQQLMARRNALYAQYAHICISTDDSTPEQVAQLVLQKLNL